MRFDISKNFKEYVGHHTLLYGETNTKKTLYTAKFVQFLVESNFDPLQITILDFGPKMNTINNLKIGGRIVDFYEDSKKCNYLIFEGEIIPPRLNARCMEDVVKNATKNHEKSLMILQKYNQKPTSTLVMNDISIYLHAGDLDYLLETIQKSGTFFGNTYHGTSINKSFTLKFSLKEKQLVETLVKKVENSHSTS